MQKPLPIPSLTGLRFIAAFSVLVAHAANWLMVFEPSVTFVGYFGRGPAIGMPLFFVLSGFVIHYNYGAAFRNGFISPTVRFFIARFARLYPLYILCLVLYIAHKGILYAWLEGADSSDLPRYLLLWQAWTIEYKNNIWYGHLLLPPAWSISVEVFFYALYPSLALPLLNIRSVQRVAVVFGVIACGFFSAIVLCYINYEFLRIWGNETFAINADPQNAFLGWLLNSGPVGRFWEFLMGALAAQAYILRQERAADRTEARIGTVVLYGLIGLTAAIYVLAQKSPFIAFAITYPGGFAPIFALLVFCCARYTNPITAALSSRPLVALGDASYSIYLLHLFTVAIFKHQEMVRPFTTNSILTWIFLMTVAVSFTLVVSIGMYRVFEVPARVRVRRLLGAAVDRLPNLRPLALRPAWGLPLVAVLGVVLVGVWPNLPVGAESISVVEATYGQSCSKVALAPPHRNTFRIGNATDEVKKACRRGTACSFLVDVNKLGDPVHGCPKDFVVTYRCAPDKAERSAVITGDAQGKMVRLTCDKGVREGAAVR
jgi:peptidoglycan/LPS O-acetylase OafA/YrhL